MNLRPYQQEDVNFLSQLPAAGCFNQQRTGKTPTALACIKAKGLEDQRVLIITTASTVYQWQQEYTRWLHKPCEVCAGTHHHRTAAIEHWTHGLVISIDSFKETSRSDGLVAQLLKLQPQMLILDEAHRIKNPKSKNAKALFKTRKIPHRLALTGTPAPNKPFDVFSILKFLYPETWTSQWKFKEEFFQAEDHFVRRFSSYGMPQLTKFTTFDHFRPGKDVELQNYLNSISTQRKRKEVMDWLPDKFYERIALNPTGYQKRYLKELHDQYRTEHVDTPNAIARIVRYRQICLDPALLELEGRSPKTDYITQYIVDNPEESIIIFSKFTSYLTKLYQTLQSICKCGIIIGETPLNARKKIVDAFQIGFCRVLLINIDAGKEGLTLDRAETTIFTDKYPPIGDIEQAEDRFIASTPERAHKAHKIIELVIKGTFDEQLYALLEQRKSETDIVNDYMKYLKERGRSRH